MRVELVYAPGCNTYRKALHVLETVIAEERLPIAIEMTEDKQQKQEPRIRINGLELGEGLLCAEHFRNTLSEKWRELTAL